MTGWQKNELDTFFFSFLMKKKYEPLGLAAPPGRVAWKMRKDGKKRRDLGIVLARRCGIEGEIPQGLIKVFLRDSVLHTSNLI